MTQGATENSHTGHGTHTTESTNVKSTERLSREIALHVPWMVTTE